MSSLKGSLRNLKQAVKNPGFALDHLRNNFTIWRYYVTADSFSKASRKAMNKWVRKDPQSAVGEWDKDIGELQFEFLKSEGLEPEDSLLDLGCGTLRGGRYFIPYLENGNYMGLDISDEAIKEGKKILGKEILRQKDVELKVNDDLKFDDIDREFSFVIAQSVFTHLPEKEIRECLGNIEKVLADNGSFYATFHDVNDRGKRRLEKYNFTYTFEKLSEIAEENNLSAELKSSEYDHPRDQKMIKFSSKT